MNELEYMQDLENKLTKVVNESPLPLAYKAKTLENLQLRILIALKDNTKREKGDKPMAQAQQERSDNSNGNNNEGNQC